MGLRRTIKPFGEPPPQRPIRRVMKNYRPDPKTKIKSDLARLDRMKDEDIDYSDIPELGDEFFSRAVHPQQPPDPWLKAMTDDEPPNLTRSKKPFPILTTP